MSSLTIADRELHFEDEGDGPPVLWVHAYPLSGEMWKEQMTIPGYRHIVPDLPGFGQSDPWDHPRDASIHWYASDLLGLLDHLKLEAVTIVGASMGGYIALDLLRSAPHRMRGLVLIDSRETPDNEEGRRKREESIRRIEQDKDTLRVVEEMIPNLLGESHRSSPELRERLRSIMASASINGVIAALRAMASRADRSDALKAAQLPLLVVVGTEDTITPPSDAERMASLVDGSRLVKIEGSGHLPPVEQPEELNQVIASFLEEVT